MTSSASKDAVVFLLDSSPSMKTPYPSNETASGSSTRLSCSKSAIEGMLGDLMLRSKTNEATVIVLKTRDTMHHLNHEDFPNLTVLTDGGVTRPTIELLRRVKDVECMDDNDTEEDLRGDLVDGIIVAADALRKRTWGKKYNRRLVIFTDAVHELVIDQEQVLKVVDSLREMECTLTVIGLDFKESAEFEHALPNEKKAKNNDEQSVQSDATAERGSDSDDNDHVKEEGDNDMETDDEDDDDEEKSPEEKKRETERFLISVARLTGGSVRAASSVQQILASNLGKRIPKSVRRKFEFHIAPGLSFEARFSLLLSKASFPSLKKEAVMFTEDAKPMVNGLGQLMTSEIQVTTDHYDHDNKDIGLSASERTQAYKYGADLIPVGSFDTEGLKQASPTCIKILGYAPQGNIPKSLMMGPPYGISGDKSQRACSAISALAQALHQMKFMALCTVVKTKDADPILGGLFPLVEDQALKPFRLFLIQLPFAGDVRQLIMPSLPETNKAEDKVCDQLIDALTLPKDVLRSDKIANPGLRSFHKTVVGRAVNPNCQVISTREKGPEDPMSTPKEILDGAKAGLAAFRNTFTLEKVQETSGKRPKKRQYYDAFQFTQEELAEASEKVGDETQL